MALMSIAIQARGHQAVSLTGSQCGIITTHNHSNARIMDVRPFRVQDELDQDRIVIVAGYQGASYRRDVTTLGRGGSDTTAVALAAALGAEACEIYSDVDGIFSADPRVVLNAQKLQSLSYEEMQEMARSGARVLNREAVRFARQAKIALYARSTHEPDKRGTLVRRIDLDDEEIARAESNCPAVAVTHVERGLWIEAGNSADAVIDVVDDRQCAILEWTPGRVANLFLCLDDIHGLEPFRRRLEEVGDDVETHIAGLVSVVGTGIGGRSPWVQRGRSALRDQTDSARHLAIYPDRLSWVVEPQQVHQVATQLHAEFIE